MLIRALTVTALAFTLAATGCKNNDSRADDSNMSAKSNAAHNQSCPVCGMKADARYTVTQDGKTACCCSQACCDKFNKSSASDKHMMMNKAWSGTSMNGATANTQEYASMENHTCPMSGKTADGTHSVVIDGHRTDFCSQQCADEYMAMSPEHRAEIRAKAR